MIRLEAGMPLVLLILVYQFCLFMHAFWENIARLWVMNDNNLESLLFRISRQYPGQLVCTKIIRI